MVTQNLVGNLNNYYIDIVYLETFNKIKFLKFFQHYIIYTFFLFCPLFVCGQGISFDNSGCSGDLNSDGIIPAINGSTSNLTVMPCQHVTVTHTVFVRNVLSSAWLDSVSMTLGTCYTNVSNLQRNGSNTSFYASSLLPLLIPPNSGAWIGSYDNSANKCNWHFNNYSNSARGDGNKILAYSCGLASIQRYVFSFEADIASTCVNNSDLNVSVYISDDAAGILISPPTGSDLITSNQFSVVVPAMANAGVDKQLCNATTTTLSANSLSVGTGSWSVVSGSGSITSPTLFNSGVTALGYDNTIFKWSVFSNGCVLSTSTVSVINYELPTESFAGSSQTICTNSTTLNGNMPSVGTGSWSVVSGAGLFASAISPTTALTGLLNGETVFKWTITNGSCAPSTSTLSVILNSLPTISVSSASVCLGNIATLTASGANTYIWTGEFSGSTFTTTESGIVTVTATAINGCVNTETASVTVYNNPTSLVSTHSVLCYGNSSGSATLTANGGASPYSYLWSSTQTTSVITGLNAGVRTVTVTDNNNCVTTNTVIVNEPLAVLSTSIAAINALCYGSNSGSATLTANGGTSPYTYLWSSAQTTSVIVSLNAGVRTVTVTDNNGCITTNTFTITEPTPLLASKSQTNITCVLNGFASVSVSGGTGLYSYNWQPTGGNAAETHSLAAGNYTCFINDENFCELTQTITITANTIQPTINISGNNNLCIGETATLTASGANTYTWNTNAQTEAITLSPNVSTTYTVEGTDAINGCLNFATKTVTVNALPAFTVNSGSICNGSSFTINPISIGAITYTISGGSFIVSPNANSTYTVVGTNTVGCTNSAISSVVVYSLPIIAVSGGTICSNSSFTLNANGAISYTYSSGSNVVNPNTTSTYSVSGTNGLGCINTTTIEIVVNTTPTIYILSVSDKTICSNYSTVITPTGASTYTLINNNSAGTSFTLSPLTTTDYTITGTSAEGCVSVNTTNTLITVNTTPTISILSVSDNTICSNYSTVITPTGASIYTLVNDNSTGTSFTISPTATTDYTITGTSAEGCVSANTTNTLITVNTTPTISILSVSDKTICSNYSTVITPTGASTYTLINNNSTGTSFTLSPLTTTDYTVTGTSAEGCVSANTTNTLITVNTTPTISILSVSDKTICSNYSTVITPTGASTYTLLNNNNAGTSFTLSPLTTTDYTVTGTSAEGCVSANITNTLISVNATPTISILSVSDKTICSNYSTVITPTGASTYTLLNNNSVGTNFTLSPLTTTDYTITGTSAEGCLSANTTNTLITVNTTPTISVTNATICSNNSVTITPLGAYSYTLQNNNSSSFFNFTLTPSVTTQYTLVAESQQGCLSYSANVFTINVNITPTVSALSGTICSGGSYVFNPISADTYTITGGSFTVAPTSFTTYILQGSTNAGCLSANTETMTVTVNALPIINVNNGVICYGNNFIINPTGAVTYTFTDSNFNAVAATVSPTASTTYSVVGTDANNCVSNSATCMVTVKALPTIVASSGTICIGNTFTISASGANSYTYSSIINAVTPTVTSTYSVSGTDINNCSNTQTLTVQVDQLPTVPNAGNDIFSDQLFIQLAANEPVIGVGSWDGYSSFGTINEVTNNEATFNANNDGEFNLVWTITNGVCPSVSDTVKVHIHQFLIPQVITPNGDGSNDYFEVKALKNVDVTLTVLNRWGNEVYFKTNYTTQFTGQNNQGELLADDTYYYILEYNNQTQKGYFIIKRN